MQKVWSHRPSSEDMHRARDWKWCRPRCYTFSTVIISRVQISFNCLAYFLSNNVYWLVGKNQRVKQALQQLLLLRHQLSKVLKLLLLQVQWQGRGLQQLQLLLHLQVHLQGVKVSVLALFDKFSVFGYENHSLMAVISLEPCSYGCDNHENHNLLWVAV
jgi:hypothetical protein